VTTPISLIDRLTAKPKRANEYIGHLDTLWEEFFESRPYVVTPKDDAVTAERTYYLSVRREFPLELSVIIGDTLQNLRSSLDHLAYHLVAVGSGLPGPFPHVYFPIFEDFAKFKAGFLARVKGMRQDAIDAISAIEPYGGGKGKVLWNLHTLNNIDKHRLLIPAWANLIGHTLLPSQRARLIKNYLGSYPSGQAPDLRAMLIAPSVKRFPLKDGDPLLTISQSEMENRMDFRLAVAFGEPIVEGEPVIETLKEMSDFVLSIILDFSRKGLLTP
jgi:hypothetical protein